jgi:hypothetical protein
MTPGEAFAAIVVVSGVDAFEEHGLDSDLAAQVARYKPQGAKRR